jgi:hypothetical protein
MEPAEIRHEQVALVHCPMQERAIDTAPVDGMSSDAEPVFQEPERHLHNSAICHWVENAILAILPHNANLNPLHRTQSLWLMSMEA